MSKLQKITKKTGTGSNIFLKFFFAIAVALCDLCENIQVTMRPSRSIRAITAAVTPVIACCSVASAIPAFPGAEGAGANALGERGGEVFHITSLADTHVCKSWRFFASIRGTAGLFQYSP